MIWSKISSTPERKKLYSKSVIFAVVSFFGIALTCLGALVLAGTQITSDSYVLECYQCNTILNIIIEE